MCVRYLGFALLIWFPGVLHAQSAAQPCSAPTLDGGYFVPVQKSYSHDTSLSYACDDGHKPAAEGWWATSTCQNGVWSPEPHCIDQNFCIPPNIPNANYKGTQNGWYKEGSTIRVNCDKGYEPKNQAATARCTRGTWSSLPICERSIDSCGKLPKIPHAVVNHQEYQEVFAVDSEVQYECEDGYTIEGGDTKKSVFCIYGKWTEGPTCRSSTSSGSGREFEHQKTTINNCGKTPSVQYGEVLVTEPMFLKYQCNNFYSLMGPEKVECYSNGKWSEVPTCKVAYCTIDTNDHPELLPVGVKYIKYDEKVELECAKEWLMDNFVMATCTDGRLILSRCCNRIQIRTKLC